MNIPDFEYKKKQQGSLAAVNLTIKSVRLF